ncbi:related to negative regulatory factor PREG [Rhynchosporium agropyri]|uniref:Related to negative regulatory factor PREG n=1 Tax=Rhynchosporium agropyri TaxID=914238 RepID=A0A1E1JRY9_9HELO|nr:related to negative regulatory factor PREG [Rhynchosporium agropyri]
MLKSLPKHRASPVTSPIFHYAPNSQSIPSSPLSRRNSDTRQKGSVPYRTPPQRAQVQYADAATQWSPIMNTKAAPPVEPTASLKNEKTAEESNVPVSAIAPSLPPSPHKPALQPESPGLKRRQSQRTVSSIPSSTTQTIRTKRPKADLEPKVLPTDYEFCAVEDMVILIADMIQELVETNDRLPLRSGVLTRFHSRTPPGISVLDYLQRLAKHATLTPPLLLSMVYYIDRLCLLYPAFTITTLTVHRFLITAATVAAKGLSDSFWNNSTYARVGGIKIAELGLLELDFLYRVDWKIVPNPEALVDYYNGLVERSDRYVLESDSSSIDEDGDDEDDSNNLNGSGSENKVETSPHSTTDTKWKAWMYDVSTNKDGDRTDAGHKDRDQESKS